MSGRVATPIGAAPYQRLFCEENAWQLAHMARERGLAARVVIVTNQRKHVAMLAQKASEQPDGLVLWDYHVFVAVERDGEWQVWDPDTRLGLPVSLEAYIEGSFAGAARWELRFQPRFRVVDGDAYLRGFASTRGHMRDARGEWLADPPSWPAIEGEGGAYALQTLWDTSDPRAGAWCVLGALRAAVTG